MLVQAEESHYPICARDVAFHGVDQMRASYCRLIPRCRPAGDEAENWEAGQNPALPPQR